MYLGRYLVKALSPVHLDLENDLILSSQFFFKNKKSGGLILSLEKFGVILYFNVLQKYLGTARPRDARILVPEKNRAA